MESNLSRKGKEKRGSDKREIGKPAENLGK